MTYIKIAAQVVRIYAMALFAILWSPVVTFKRLRVFYAIKNGSMKEGVEALMRATAVAANGGYSFTALTPHNTVEIVGFNFYQLNGGKTKIDFYNAAGIRESGEILEGAYGLEDMKKIITSCFLLNLGVSVICFSEAK